MDIKNQILDLFLQLTAEQQSLDVDFAQSMLEADTEEAPAERE